MRTAIHPAVFLSGALVFCALWLWLEPVQRPFENMTTSRSDVRAANTSIKLDPAILERGRYEGRADFAVDLSMKDGRLYLYAQTARIASFEMLATSELEFFLKESPEILVKFRVDRRGGVTGFDAATPYGPMRLSRAR
jgi:hypothetical protein